MNETQSTKQNMNEQAFYEIRLEGHMADRWGEWFGGLTITLERDGTTLLNGPVVDQAALYGLLRKVRDLNMPLISVIRKQLNDGEKNDESRKIESQ